MAKTKKVRTRKRGKTWSYIFEAGQVNGKRKVVEKGGFATEKNAYNAGVETYNDFMHGNIGITSEAITLKDFMTRWLEEVVSLNVKANTLQTYQSILNERRFVASFDNSGAYVATSRARLCVSPCQYYKLEQAGKKFRWFARCGKVHCCRRRIL